MSIPPHLSPKLVTCRECGCEVSTDALNCPKCAAPRPAQHDWNGQGYEWRSRGTWMGYPLVHIAFGCDRAGRARTACGIVAVGQRAVGVIACGILAGGVVSFGVVSGGVISLGVVSVALACAVGVNALAPLAFGVTAIGYAVGGVAVIGAKILFSVTPPPL